MGKKVSITLGILITLSLCGCGKNRVDITILDKDSDNNRYSVTYTVSSNELDSNLQEVSDNEIESRINNKMSSDSDIQLFINDNLKRELVNSIIFDNVSLVISGTFDDVKDIFDIKIDEDDSFYKASIKYKKDIPSSYDDLDINIKVYGNFIGVMYQDKSRYRLSEYNRNFLITWQPNNDNRTIEVYWSKGDNDDEKVS